MLAKICVEIKNTKYASVYLYRMYILSVEITIMYYVIVDLQQ